MNQPSQKEVDQLLGYYHAGKLAEALKLAKSLSVRHPEFPLCWKVLTSLLRVLSHQEKALDANQKAIKLQPNDGEAHYNLANLLNEMDRFEEAKQSFKNAITLSQILPRHTITLVMSTLSWMMSSWPGLLFTCN